MTANARSKVYGAALPSLTYSYSGLVNGDTASVFTGALATTATVSSGSGTYPVTQGTLSAGLNYAVNFNPGTLTIIASLDQPTVTTVTSSNSLQSTGSG